MNFFVGTGTQLFILPPHIPGIVQGGGKMLLHYSIICIIGPAIFIMNGRGENITPSFAKL